MVNVPVCDPDAPGVNVTCTVQAPPFGATGAPQVFVSANSLVVWSEEMVRGPVPLFVMVT
jgi:hypothetical protein